MDRCLFISIVSDGFVEFKMGACGFALVFCGLYVLKMTSAVLQARFCVTSKAEMEKCKDMRSSFDGANLKQIGCVQGRNQYDCMSLIKSGKAELMRADDTDIYAAGKYYGLVPILSESSATDVSAPSYLYKAVVVIRKNSPIKSVDQLYKQKSCHTGVGRTVGWTVPVSNLIAMKTMSVVDCDNPVASVGAFFSQSCAPEAFTQANDIDNINPTNICSLCEDRRCPNTDKYAGYSGAIQCLLDGRGTVAFAKHSTIDTLAQRDVAIQKDDFRLLCRDGTVKGVNEWNKCSWATRPTDAILASGALPTDTVGALRDLIEQGSRQFNGDTSGFNMFSSSNYDGTNLMFTDGTKRLSHVTTSDYRSYLGEGYLNTMTNYINCPVTDRWCVTSDVEQNKCTQIAAAFAAARITNKMACVRAQTHLECMQKIKDGDADLVTLDGGDVYLAGKKYGLVPILAENYGDVSSTSYYAVAVVRRSNSGVTFNNLKGKTSCHTGIEKTSGWNIPIGTLLEKKYISESKRKCDVIRSVGKFFSKSCVPGALDSRYNPTGSNPESLCDLCGGRASCQRDSSNKYYDYAGALRCLEQQVCLDNRQIDSHLFDLYDLLMG